MQEFLFEETVFYKIILYSIFFLLFKTKSLNYKRCNLKNMVNLKELKIIRHISQTVNK